MSVLFFSIFALLTITPSIRKDMASEYITNCMLCGINTEIFSALNKDELRKIDNHRVSIRYNPGEIIFKQGTPCHSFVCVTTGLVKLYLEHHHNSNLIIGLMRPINYIFEPGFFIDQHHHFTALAAEETTACLIDFNVMKDLVFSNQAFSYDFIQRISRQALGLFRRISSCTHKHVYGKVADTLLYLQPNIYKENPFVLSLSRQDLADLSGITKESVIRVLKKFQDDGIVSINGDQVEIFDRERLEVISVKG